MGTPETVHRLGLVRLARNELDTAVSLLHQAGILDDGGSAWNDLSVAYLARFEQSGDVRNLLQARWAAQRSVDADPRCIQARFNLAVALTSLELRRSAEPLWRSVERMGAGACWTSAVREWRHRPDQVALEELWPAQRQSLLDGGLSQDGTADLVRKFPYRARIFVERELLPRWAAETEVGDPGAQVSLHVARQIAGELVRQNRDHLAADAVRLAQEASHTDPPPKVLLQGTISFGQGLEAFDVGDSSRAERLFREAATDLGVAGSALQGWARLFAALCRYYDDADRAYEELSALSGVTDETRYPALAGRIQWILGTIDLVQFRAQEAMSRYRRAHDLLERASGPAQAAFIHVLQAELLAELGLRGDAWAHWSQAVGQVPRFCIQRRWEAFWSALALDLLRQGQAELGLAFLDEFVLVTEHHADPSARAQARIDRAEVLAHLDAAAARVEIGSAYEIVATMPDGPLKETMRHQLLVATGWNDRKRSPESALSALTRAQRLAEERGYQFDELRVWAALGSVHRALGNTENARAWLIRAVERYERQRLEIANAPDRREILRRAQPAYDELLALDLESGRPVGEVFSVAERARARAQRDEFGESGGDRATPDIASLETLAEIFMDGHALVYYALSAESAAAIVVEEAAARLVDLAVDPVELQTEIEGFRAELEGRAPRHWLDLRSARMFDLLIRPLGLAAATQEVVFIPDRILQKVPFGVLRDGEGRYLVESRPVSVAPSASLWLRERLPAPASKLGTALAIAGAAAPLPGYPALERLGFVDEEVELVAKLYPRGAVARGDGLDPAALAVSVAGHDVVHFAGHAMIDPDNIESSVLLLGATRAAGSRQAAGLRLEAFRRNPPTGVRLFFLSACGTSDVLGTEREGIYGFAGMLQAFGVPQVVATLWPVDDKASFRMAAAFHGAHSRGLDAPEALRAALLATRETIELSDWAAFVVLTSYRGESAAAAVTKEADRP